MHSEPIPLKIPASIAPGFRQQLNCPGDIAVNTRQRCDGCLGLHHFGCMTSGSGVERMSDLGRKQTVAAHSTPCYAQRNSKLELV
jgi:hypothetical protein